MSVMKKLKAKSLRNTIIRLVVCLALAAVCMYFGGIGAIHFLFGTAPDYSDFTADEVEGKFVKLEIFDLLGGYAYTETDRGRLISNEYAVTPDYMHVLGVVVKSADDDKFIAQWEQVMEQYNSGNYEGDEPTMTVMGTVEEMDYESKRFFQQEMGSIGLADHQMRLLYLHMNEYNGVYIYICYGMLAGAVLLLVFGLYGVIKAATGGYQKQLRRYFEASGNPEGAMDKLDAWYPEAYKIGTALFGPDCILYQSGATTNVIPTGNLVWAYQKTTRTNGAVTSQELMMGTVDSKLHSKTLNRNGVAEALQYIDGHYPWVALGYSADFAKLLKNNPAGLRDIAASQHQPPQPAVAATASGPNGDAPEA